MICIKVVLMLIEPHVQRCDYADQDRCVCTCLTRENVRKKRGGEKYVCCNVIVNFFSIFFLLLI